MATLNKRGKSWVLTWSEPGCKSQRRKSLGQISKTDAKTILHAKEVELKTGRNILIHATSGMYFEAFANEYLDWHKFEFPDSHPRVYQLTQQHLIPHFKYHTLMMMKTKDGEDYKQQRAKKVMPSTVNKELRTLKAILNKAVVWDRLDKMPLKNVNPLKDLNSKPKRFFESDELEQVYEADTEYSAVWRLLANTGMRRSEAVALKWEQVYDDKVRLLSTSKDRTKSGKWRDIPLSPGAKKALANLKANDDATYVLPRVTKHTLSRAFSRTLKRLDIEGSLHDLRHTFISHLVMQGIPLRTVQVLAGHSSFKTTEGYAHLAPEHLQDSVAMLDL